MNFIKEVSNRNNKKKGTYLLPLSLEPRENKIGNPNFVCSDSFLECFGYSKKSLENSGIMMMIARCPKTEGSGPQTLICPSGTWGSEQTKFGFPILLSRRYGDYLPLCFTFLLWWERTIFYFHQSIMGEAAAGIQSFIKRGRLNQTKGTLKGL